MGVKLFDLVSPKEITLEELRGKVIAVDASLFLYQFLSSIRQRDGSLLTDSHGNVTSHLVGLFSRVCNLMEKGVKLVFVFDGKPPELKLAEQERRRSLKEAALKLHADAVERGDVDDMKKFASRMSKLTKEMVAEAKELLLALGIPIVQAQGEGEAQAAYLVKCGDAFAIATQDGDSLLFGAERVVRNLAILGRRKKASKLSYIVVKPELISLAEVLNELGIDQEQLIVLGMLVGTDYNYGGIKGIGPKKALALVKEFGDNFSELFAHVKWDECCAAQWEEVFYAFKRVPVTDKYELVWSSPDESRVMKLLVDEHDFSVERVKKALAPFKVKEEKKKQKGLSEWC